MKYFNCFTCSCCKDKPEENELANINNNNNIKESNDNEEQLQNIKKKNSAIKIQRVYRAFHKLQQKKKKQANIFKKDFNNNTIDNHENLEEIYNYDPKKLDDIFTKKYTRITLNNNKDNKIYKK